jgi:hypothetical protein
VHPHCHLRHHCKGLRVPSKEILVQQSGHQLVQPFVFRRNLWWQR